VFDFVGYTTGREPAPAVQPGLSGTVDWAGISVGAPAVAPPSAGVLGFVDFSFYPTGGTITVTPAPTPVPVPQHVSLGGYFSLEEEERKRKRKELDDEEDLLLLI
jgi:hypothetical protein